MSALLRRYHAELDTIASFVDCRSRQIIPQVGDTNDFAIGCALMQYDADDVARVVCYQTHQLQPAERNYPFGDKELLAMKYALVKLRVYLLGDRRFIVFTDHASLLTVVNSPLLLQRMANGCHYLWSKTSPSSTGQDDLMSSLTHARAGPISIRLRHPTLVRPLSWY